MSEQKVSSTPAIGAILNYSNGFSTTVFKVIDNIPISSEYKLRFLPQEQCPICLDFNIHLLDMNKAERHHYWAWYCSKCKVTMVIW